jgi:hypothetical protein
MTAATPEPTGPTVDERDGNRTLYWIIGGVVVVLCIVGLITYSGNQQTAEAQEKAQQLVTKLDEAGLRVPEDIDIIVRTLGTDGGAVCDNPASALGRAAFYDQMTNGADFVGRRPVIIDRRAVVAEALILETYCPDELQEFRDKFDDLKTDDVIRD